ncbi:MAG: circularly permuted type 2 ATP-grasp protein [Vicinamibacterales bacterium]
MTDPTPRSAATKADTLSPLLGDYAVPDGHYDELRTDAGALRQVWRTFAAAEAELNGAACAQAQQRVARQIDENGVTYNIFATDRKSVRPWTLDVLPMIIAAAEWHELQRGLRQRARLLNDIASDIYGAQTLVRDGLLPPALIFKHPGFLRACHGVRPAGGTFLNLAAFDLARGGDGRWRVVAQRTQAPSGLGYALENRAVVSRVFPDGYRALTVQPLSPFFHLLRETLTALAPVGGGAPNIVLLTPGPYSETYFEHAYLARQLGFPLVEGSDLTVRHDRAFLKTVSGLRPVHAILRRLDDDFCDPVELRADSALGVPGLVQAWRAGNVLVANSFGLGVLESSALFGFLPAICQQMLGEPLEMPSLATWWCGEAAAVADARQRLERGVIKPAFARAAMQPVFTSELDVSARKAWEERLGTSQDDYVVEEFLPLSQAPVWQHDRIESRALMLRVFLLADGHGDYRVMPGALARIAGSDPGIVSSGRGGSSKDAWVVAGATPARPTPIAGRARSRDSLGERVTSSRAAESLFWLGRYAERSENAARLLRAVLSRLSDGGSTTASMRPAFIRVCERHELLLPPANGTRDDSREQSDAVLARELLNGVFDSENRHSLRFNVEQTVRVAGAVRDRLSTDNWRVLNRMVQRFMKWPEAGGHLDEALEIVDDTLIALVAVGGLEMAHMTRDQGWRFLSLGRHLERLQFIATSLIESAARPQDADASLLEWLLELSDSVLTYRVRYVQRPEWHSVMDLIVFDERNPRSAHFQVAKLAKHVRLLPDAPLGDVIADADRVLVACETADSHAGAIVGAIAPSSRCSSRSIGSLRDSPTSSHCAISVTSTMCRGRRWRYERSPLSHRARDAVRPRWSCRYLAARGVSDAANAGAPAGADALARDRPHAGRMPAAGRLLRQCRRSVLHPDALHHDACRQPQRGRSDGVVPQGGADDEPGMGARARSAVVSGSCAVPAGNRVQLRVAVHAHRCRRRDVRAELVSRGTSDARGCHRSDAPHS